MIEGTYGNFIHIQEYSTYTVSELDRLFAQIKGLVAQAEQAGFTKTKVTFTSTSDYDGCAGPVKVTVEGMRPMNNYEKTQALLQIRTQDLADKLGVSFYEASIIQHAKDMGKVTINGV